MWLEKWSPYATNYTCKQANSRVLFSGWSSSIPWLFQRNGVDYPWAGTLACNRDSPGSMRGLQMWTWDDKLLLPTASVYSARFCWPEISAWRTHHVKRAHLWLLSKISLWVEFYWAILGGCQIPLLWFPFLAGNTWGNGEKSARVFR